jgi:FMN-dependent NADH-azoreductase
MKRIINCETGEVIDREFNEEELAQLDADIAASEAIEAAKEAEAAAKAEAKAALLERLGITAEEASLLLG